MNDKAMQMVGLCAKAGKCVFGADAVRQAVRAGKAYCVLLDEQASERTKKDHRDMCSYYEVPLLSANDPCSAAGKLGKKSMAIVDENMANAVIEKFYNG